MVQKNSLTVIAIYGPTGVGKSAVAVELAKKIGGEIISADSMQIYRKLDIGTAKVTVEEMQGIPHHLIDIIDFDKTFSVAEFKELAEKTMAKIFERGKVPILVGGTGLYFSALINNFDFNNTIADVEFRSKLEDIAKTHGNDFLYEMLEKENPELAGKTNKNNRKRVIRYLEILNSKGKEDIKFQLVQDRKPEFNYLLFGLTAPRDIIYERINARVDKMIKTGLLKEAKMLLDSGFNENWQCFSAIGYKEVITYLKGEEPLQNCIDLLKQKSRNYAKRQLTYLKQFSDIKMIEVDSIENASSQIIKEINAKK